jgi:SAM-dependent methyltransferase
MPDTTLAAAPNTAVRTPPRWNWTIVRRLIAAWFRDRSQFARPRIARTCPICFYHGRFVSVGRPPRWDVRCLNCGGRERHRLTHLWATDGGGDKLAGKRILHFAPEKAVRRQMRGNRLYETADLHQKGTTHRVDITRVDLPDASYDIVIAHHVLEHIDDDRAAMRELFRLLKPGGLAVLSVPVNPTRRETYENAAITAPALRVLHFGGDDHKRYYGLDFADRLAATGFTVDTFRMPPQDEVRYGLLRDEWIYIATKPTVTRSGA